MYRQTMRNIWFLLLALCCSAAGAQTLPSLGLKTDNQQLVEDAVKFSKRVGAKRTYLTHLTHRIGLHENACRQLPEGFTFAYDGLIIEI